MRPKAVSAAALALVGLVFASPVPAAANGDGEKSEARTKVRHAAKHAYYARYAPLYKEDPYAWSYSPRGYYPYYNSGYWGPASYMKWRNRVHLNVWITQPPYYRYYKAWGYPRPWNNREWHREHDGFTHRWHW
jgi:hypothetical protein